MKSIHNILMPCWVRATRERILLSNELGLQLVSVIRSLVDYLID